MQYMVYSTIVQYILVYYTVQEIQDIQYIILAQLYYIILALHLLMHNSASQLYSTLAILYHRTLAILQ